MFGPAYMISVDVATELIDVLLIWPLGTYFSESRIHIVIIFFQESAFKNVVCKMSSYCSNFHSLSLLILKPEYSEITSPYCGC